MKNKVIPLVAMICFTVTKISAQAKGDYVEHTEKRAISSKPALVQGNSSEVVFGSIPVLQIKHSMLNNTAIRFNGEKYYYDNGDFFIYNGGRYLLVLPPVSLVVDKLAPHKEEVGNNIFFYKGIFYKKIATGYEVIEQPLGAIIYNLPEMTDVVSIGEEGYYEYLGILYKRVFVKGEQAYEVVGQLIDES